MPGNLMSSSLSGFGSRAFCGIMAQLQAIGSNRKARLFTGIALIVSGFLVAMSNDAPMILAHIVTFAGLLIYYQFLFSRKSK